MQILLWRRQQEFRSSSGRWKPHIEIITFKRKIGFFSGIDVGLIGTKLWCVYIQQKLLPSLVFLQSDIVLCFQMFYLVKYFSYFGDPQNWQQYFRKAALTTVCLPRLVSTPSARTGTSTTARCSSPAPSAATGTTTPSARTPSASSIPWPGQCSNQKYILWKGQLAVKLFLRFHNFVLKINITVAPSDRKV